VVRLAADAVATRRCLARAHIARSEIGTTTSATVIRALVIDRGGACHVRMSLESADSRRADRESGEPSPTAGASGRRTPASPLRCRVVR